MHDDSVPFLLRLETGPDSGRAIPIDRGQLVLGRAPGPGRIDDRAIDAHHVLIRRDGRSITATQLAGRVPIRIDGEVPGVGAELGIGSVLELGATCAVVADRTTDDPSDDPSEDPADGEVVVLGVGIDSREREDRPEVGSWSFAELALEERERSAAAVTLDLAEVRRLLVTGPAAPGLVRAIVAQTKRRRVLASTRRGALRSLPPPGRLVVVEDAEHVGPETGWPGDELPADAAVISVGATWHALLLRQRAVDGAIEAVRFRASGRPTVSPSTSRCSRPDRTLVAQQVAGTAAELGGDVVGVPEPARRERQAPAADALVELVPQAGEERDLLVEPWSP